MLAALRLKSGITPLPPRACYPAAGQPYRSGIPTRQIARPCPVALAKSDKLLDAIALPDPEKSLDNLKHSKHSEDDVLENASSFTHVWLNRDQVHGKMELTVVL